MSHPTIAEIIAERDAARAELESWKQTAEMLREKNNTAQEHLRDLVSENAEAGEVIGERTVEITELRARVALLEGLLRDALRNRGMGFNGGIYENMCVIDREILVRIETALAGGEGSHGK